MLSRARCFAHRRPVQALCGLAGLALVLGAGCQGGSGGEAASAGGAGAVAAAPPPATPAPAPPANPGFDADRAFADLKAQCDFGPRAPGTPGHRAARDWILGRLKQTADTAALQPFSRTFDGKKLDMWNIVAEFEPPAGVTKKVMLCAHWDTRPTADEEIDAEKQRQPILGANDGASGVAVLLELARQFRAKRPPVGVQIVLFDGEDYGPGLDRMFLGARHYARNPFLAKPGYAILIDMIGDKDLQIYRERNSEDGAPEINDKVWKAARDLNIAAFKDGVRHTIQDDHIPLLEAGWKAIDLIDFDYAPWHTLDDTPDKCSPTSLKAVGDVLARVVHTEKP